MAVSKKQYDKMTKASSPPSPKIKNLIKAFLFGGIICVIGQVLFLLYGKLGLKEDEVKLLVSSTLIVATAILTAIGVFDNIARHAGAGTIVPITGFANSIVSPAMEFHREGQVLGTGAQLFSIAGPVIAYSTAAGVIYGVIYFFIQKFA